MTRAIHGGTDADGSVPHDFSTNVNAAGPCSQVLSQLQRVLPDSYPDPAYTALRRQLGQWHGVDPQRILIGASGSELIFRMTAAMVALAAESGHRPVVHLPAHAYDDYRRAADAWRLPVRVLPGTGIGQPLFSALATAQMPQALPKDLRAALAPGPQPACLPSLPRRCEPASIPAGLALGEPYADDDEGGGPRLIWACEPSSPLGLEQPGLRALVQQVQPDEEVLVLDLAYAPLRLQGESSLDAAAFDRVWQLITPNKALGLTGVRAAYLIAPAAALSDDVGPAHRHPDDPGESVAQDGSSPGRGWSCRLLAQLLRLAPSWEIGAHGLVLLQQWTEATTQAWLRDSLPRLRQWKAAQVAGLLARGWTIWPSDSHFFCARPPCEPGGDDSAPATESQATGAASEAAALTLAQLLAHLRQAGVKLRDARSFGLPGWVRIGVRSPDDQQALWRALDAWVAAPVQTGPAATRFAACRSTQGT